MDQEPTTSLETKCKSDIIEDVAGSAFKMSTAINRNIKYRMMNAESNASQGHQAKTPISSTEIRNPSGTVISVNQDEPKCCPDGIGNPSPCKYSKSQEQLADSQYYAQQGLEQNFMAQAIPSYRQEGSPSEAKVNCFGFGDKVAKQGRNTKECDSYNSDRMSGGDHGNKTSLNTGTAAPRVAYCKVADPAKGVQSTLHGRRTRSQGLLEQTPNGMSATSQPLANIGQSTKSQGAKDTTEKNNSDAGRLKDFPEHRAPSKCLTTSTDIRKRPPVHRAGGETGSEDKNFTPPSGTGGADSNLGGSKQAIHVVMTIPNTVPRQAAGDCTANDKQCIGLNATASKDFGDKESAAMLNQHILMQGKECCCKGNIEELRVAIAELSGTVKASRKEQQGRAMLAARKYCIDQLASSYVKQERLKKLAIKEGSPAVEHNISEPEPPSAEECEYTVKSRYVADGTITYPCAQEGDSDLDDLPALVGSSEDEDNLEDHVAVTIDSGASKNVQAPVTLATNLRRSSRKVSPLTHFKLGANRPAVGSRKAPPTTNPEVAASTPGAVATKRKVRESTPPAPVPALVVVYLDDIVSISPPTHSKPARKVRARRSRTSSRSNTSGVSASADSLDFDST